MLEFIKWHSHNNLTAKLSTQTLDLSYNPDKIIFNKDKECAAIAKMIHNKSPYEYLQEKNRDLQSSSSSVGRNYMTNQLSSKMTKWYSVTSLNENCSSSLAKISVLGRKDANNIGPSTPSKSNYHSHLVDPKYNKGKKLKKKPNNIVSMQQKFGKNGRLK